MSEILFDWNITTTKWQFDSNSYLVLEKTLSGYIMYGRVNGRPWDNDGDDFYFEDTDELLAFLQEEKLLGALSHGYN